jgi:glycerophosphoryl diester phosphodiesterase
LHPRQMSLSLPQLFDLQGHRGARGQKPENTLPSFEAALDSGVTSIETDLHLARDGIVVLYHDPTIPGRLCRGPAQGGSLLISSLNLGQLRAYRADLNPEPECFPEQNAAVTPLARLFAAQRGMDAFAPPTLHDLFEFASAYVGELGAKTGKTEQQRAKAHHVVFDLELKRVPGHPEYTGDDFDGISPALLEKCVVDAIEQAGVVHRTRVRSFDHRSVRAVRQLCPALRTAVLVDALGPIGAVESARAAQATTCCPRINLVDEALVRQLHEADIRVVPWTVNDPSTLERLLDWHVDGVTTDYPERCAQILRARHIAF